MEALPSQRGNKGKTRGNGYKLHWVRLCLDIRHFFNGDNNQSLKQSLQARVRVPIIGDFQDAIVKGSG